MHQTATTATPNLGVAGISRQLEPEVIEIVSAKEFVARGTKDIVNAGFNSREEHGVVVMRVKVARHEDIGVRISLQAPID